MSRLITVLFFTCSIFCLSAQDSIPRWPLQAGFSFAGVSYTGDYSDGASSLSRVYPGANLSIQSTNPRPLKLQLNLGFGKFAEQYDTDAPSLPPEVEIPTFIETSFIYGDLRLKYHFFNQKKFQPYLSAGAGVMFFSPKDQDGKKLVRRPSSRLEGEDFNDIVPELPLSAGVHFHLTRSLWIDLSYTYRYTPTDYLDNLGLAGGNNGFDALHAVQLGLQIDLGPRPDKLLATPPPPVEKEKVPDWIANQFGIEQTEDTLEHVADTIAREAESQVGKTDTLLAETAKTPVEIAGDTVKKDAPVMEPMEESAPKTESKSEPAIKPESDTNTDSDNTKEAPKAKSIKAIRDAEMRARAAKAIEREYFIYYRVQKGDDFESLAEKFFITEEQIRKINLLSKAKLKKGSLLRLPNIGIKY
ncbi:MAG: outer membrane beta-barrel protein [Bacteroidota bacterium]